MNDGRNEIIIASISVILDKELLIRPPIKYHAFLSLKSKNKITS
jgi:hypothetical protein